MLIWCQTDTLDFTPRTVQKTSKKLKHTVPLSALIFSSVFHSLASPCQLQLITTSKCIFQKFFSNSFIYTCKFSSKINYQADLNENSKIKVIFILLLNPKEMRLTSSTLNLISLWHTQCAYYPLWCGHFASTSTLTQPVRASIPLNVVAILLTMM